VVFTNFPPGTEQQTLLTRYCDAEMKQKVTCFLKFSPENTVLALPHPSLKLTVEYLMFLPPCITVSPFTHAVSDEK